MVVEQAIGRLGDLNLSADQELERFYGRNDEIGMIAQTTHRVCGCLRKTIDDVGRILGEIAGGNLAVDVTENASYYIGDFQALSQGTMEQAASIDGLVSNVSAITSQILKTARCAAAAPASWWIKPRATRRRPTRRWNSSAPSPGILTVPQPKLSR